MDGENKVPQIKLETVFIKKAAHRLRKTMTPAETKVWEILRGGRLMGLKFRRQHALHGYVLDFYCHEKRLCIELDGAPHLEPAQNAKDNLRDKTLRSKGYKVLRLMNDQVRYNPEWFKQQLLYACLQPPH